MADIPLNQTMTHQSCRFVTRSTDIGQLDATISEIPAIYSEEIGRIVSARRYLTLTIVIRGV